jgi:alpha-D-ribose 1-methylphosphonate 5-triphosphate diphosphatase PhnM
VSDTKQAEASEREKWKALCALPQFGPRFENSDGSWEWRHELLPEVRDRILALAAENAELRAKLAAAEKAEAELARARMALVAEHDEMVEKVRRSEREVAAIQELLVTANEALRARKEPQP